MKTKTLIAYTGTALDGQIASAIKEAGDEPDSIQLSSSWRNADVRNVPVVIVALLIWRDLS